MKGNNLFKNVFSIQKEMERMLNHFLRWRPSLVLVAENVWKPHTDVYETSSDIVVIVDLAGVHQEEIEISLTNEALTIRGERRENPEIKKENYYMLEINFGPFERSVVLPRPVQPNKVRVTYKNGFLEVILPKAKEKKAEEIVIPIKEG